MNFLLRGLSQYSTPITSFWFQSGAHMNERTFIDWMLSEACSRVS